MHDRAAVKSPKSSVVNVRIAPEEKSAADAVMAELGVTPTAASTIKRGKSSSGSPMASRRGRPGSGEEKKRAYCLGKAA